MPTTEQPCVRLLDKRAMAQRRACSPHHLMRELNRDPEAPEILHIGGKVYCEEAPFTHWLERIIERARANVKPAVPVDRVTQLNAARLRRKASRKSDQAA